MNEIIGIRTAADIELIKQASEWLSGSLGCLFGRREWFHARYVLAVIRDAESFSKANSLFQARVAAGTHSACLYIVSDPIQGADVRQTLDWLRNEFLTILDLSGNGDVFSQPITVACPVTGRPTTFPDFDIVGFCPQAGNEDDVLYDPSVHAPIVCMNQTSDFYGFSIYVREIMDLSTRDNFGCPLSQSAAKALIQWDDMARKTIEIFHRRTNKSILCPATTSSDGRHYITPHDEATFSESDKRMHISEMPRAYLPRLIAEWECQIEGKHQGCLHRVVRPAICLADLGLSGLESARISA